MWAWCFLNDETMQSSIQSLPRELSLPKDSALHISPLRELESLRSEERSEADITVKSEAHHRLKEIAGDALELQLSE
jgi:sucrose-6-phosphate hydrolase SacC (GH32 family)